MAVHERKRHEMYLSLERTLGREAADTLMEHLPGVGWAEVATRYDLAILAAATKTDLAHYAEVDTKEHEALKSAILAVMHRGFRNQTFALITVMSVINGVMLGVLKVS